MYIPHPFSAPDAAAIRQLIQSHPFATLVVPQATGLEIHHLPLCLHDEHRLSGHLARAHPLWSQLQQALPVTAIFHGPHAYVTPRWYPATAAGRSGVPTWNYAVVHACGHLRVINDPQWLLCHLQALTAAQEAASDQPWRMESLTTERITQLLQSVVGIEICLTALSGKWKLSQNQPLQQQIAIRQGLFSQPDTQAQSLAAMMNIPAATHNHQP